MKRRMLSLIFAILAAGVLLMFASSSHRLEQYEGTMPEADIMAYFNGPIKAWGMVEDWRGRVISRFDVEMVGTWEGDTGTLTEHFTYYGGEKQERVWTIKKIADGRYEGTASDIIGTATGASNGSAIRWKYVMNLPVGKTNYLIRFDDWMWQMNNGVMINRSYLKKFGFTVAELTLFMQKEKP